MAANLSSQQLAMLEVYEQTRSPALTEWRPWKTDTGESPQLEFIRAAQEYRTRIFRAGNRSGKTEVCARELAARLLGYSPYAHCQPPINAWASGLTWDHGIGEIIWPKLDRYLPPAVRKHVIWLKRDRIPQVVYLWNGSKVEFKSAEAGRSAYEGTSQHLIWLDEEHPEDVYKESGARLLDTGGEMMLSYTPLRGEAYLPGLETQPGIYVQRASMLAAARAGLFGPNGVAVVREYLDSLSDSEREVREHGEYRLLEGLVYRDFDRRTCTARPVGDRLVTRAGIEVAPWPIPPEWPRYLSVDFGYSHPTAVLQMVRCPWTGRSLVERVLYQRGIRASVWPAIIRKHLGPWTGAIAADHDRQEREEFHAKGLRTIPARKDDLIAGIEAVARWWKPLQEGDAPRLVLVCHDPGDAPVSRGLGRTDAEALAQELLVYRYPDGPKRAGVSAPRDQPIKRDDHACDALRYGLCTHFESSGPMLPPTIRPTSGSDGDLIRY